MAVTILSLPRVPVDRRSRQFAEEIAGLPGVVDVQLLPDCFTKDKYVGVGYKITVPSSSAIVTEADILYPQLRSRGINCGMMVVSLPVTKNELTEAFIEDLLHELTYDPLYYVLYRLRLPWYAKPEDLSYRDFIATLEGEDIKIEDVSHLLNRDWLTKRTVRMRRSVGRYFGGNHYFELQVAENDSPELGLKAGQVTAMFHTGCEGIQSVIRKDLAKKYFYQDRYVSTAKGEEMYEAFFTAQGMLQNYTVAYRNATKRIVDSVLEKHYSRKSVLVINKGHNGVEREQVSKKERLVYRHNAERLGGGGTAIVSGMYDHPSYIVRGELHAEEYYNTIDHGLGMLLEQDEHKVKASDQYARLYRYKYGIRWMKSEVVQVPIQRSRFVENYFELLEEKKIAHRLVSLRPFLNMKHSK